MVGFGGIRNQERLTRLGQDKPLERLTSRHLLLVLDCCFGGALAFDFFRGGGTPERPIYYSEYKRFVEGTAWQLLNSASSNQQAMDRDPKDPDDPHSPFARAFLEGLTTERADAHRQGSRSDQIITATELHQFIDRRLRQRGVDIQTPGLMPLRPLEGQFIFHVPGFKPTPLPDPVLRPEFNPWRGGDAEGGRLTGGVAEEFFHGRELATLELLESYLALPRPLPGAERWPSLVVHGPSGSGATSLVRAGLLPLLAQPVVGRTRLQSFLRRRGLEHYLVSRDDLKTVRHWARELELATWLEQPEALAERLRRWAVEQGMLEDREESAAQMQARMEREHYGVPSFAPDRRPAETWSWLRRLGLMQLLATPATLSDRLRLWLAVGGVMDFLTVAERALGGLVGSFKVVTELPITAQGEDLAEGDEPAEGGERGEDLLLWIDPGQSATAETWREIWHQLAEGPPTRTLASLRAEVLERDPAVRQALAARDAEGRPLWRRMAVPRASRDELREVITFPAATKALFFEPPELVDRLVTEVEQGAAPLPWLAMTLSHMYARAWDRRREADRQLLLEDLGPRGAVGVLAEQAEVCCRRLLEQEPDSRPLLDQLFLRLVARDGEQTVGRQVSWRELDLVHPTARQRVQGLILPALVHDRVLVAAEHHVELASPGLIDHWPRLRNLLGKSQESQVDAQVVWRRAVEWERGGFERGKLWARDRNVRTLLRSITLNQLEWAFVVASEMERRAFTLQALANLALHSRQRAWDRGAVLVATAAEFAVATGELVDRLLAEPLLACGEPWVRATEMLEEVRARSTSLAEHALRDVLGETPLAVPLELPVAGAITGLGCAAEGTLQVRIDDQVWAWDLRHLEAAPRRLPGATGPRLGAAKAAPRWLPLLHDVAFPAVSAGLLGAVKAQASHDGSIRFLVPRRRRFWGPPRVQGSALLGHRGVPTFLAFSRRGFPGGRSGGAHQPRRWLVSAANSPAGGEVRCWPCGENWSLFSEPRTLRHQKLAQVVLDAAPGGGQRVMASDPLPTVRTVAGNSWQVESRSADGLSFVVRNLSTQEKQEFRLPSVPTQGDAVQGDAVQGDAVQGDAVQGEAESPAAPGRAPGVPWSAPPPTLADLGAPPLPPGLLPPWLRGDQHGVREILLSPDGKWLAAVSEAGAAGLWSLPDGRRVWSTGGPEDSPVGGGRSVGVSCLAFHPVADHPVVLAVGTHAGNPWFVVAEGPPRVPEQGPMGRISAMVWSPDGQRLAVGCLDGTVCLWSLRAGNLAAAVPPVVLPGPAGFAVRGLAFDGSGKRLAVERRAVYEPYARRVDVHRMDLEELITLLRGHTGRTVKPSDLPAELWLNLFDGTEAEGKEDREGRNTETNDRKAHHREKLCYLIALGLLDGSTASPTPSVEAHDDLDEITDEITDENHLRRTS